MTLTSSQRRSITGSLEERVERLEKALRDAGIPIPEEIT